MILMFLQLLPEGNWQILFLMYRCITSVYVLVWLVQGIAGIGSKYFIYLTNWSFILLTLYLFVAATSSTLKFIIHRSHGSQSEPHQEHDDQDVHIQRRESQTTLGADYTTNVVWYQKVQWLLATVALEYALFVSILYWSFVHDEGDEVSAVNVHVHAINGVISICDIMASGTMIRVLHVVYGMFGAVYIVFTVIYYVTGGTNEDGVKHIYTILDYENHPGHAAVVICITPVFHLLLHIAIYTLYRIRQWSVNRWCKRQENTSIQAST